MKTRYIRGTHNAISDISGQEFKRSEMVFNWKGQLVDRLTEFEPKQPQLTIRGRTEIIAVTDGTRVEAADPPLLNPPLSPSDML